ncbi:hypothetical protein ISO73_17610 [Morganella morganii subsp. morganii]|uniref:Uncharacterized protein n=1 Tax=Morganella morganii TaxID=582 RepID=A0AAE4FIM9_MORMO|nr:hypothetical protein [Morganella morganii]AUT99879.1 hypothetical protein MC49_006715 [Morganella morganii]ELB3894379.1 hypothetical protein [Morganella morganii]MBT0437494.1 hypothetical protein [Morganella morganii subsp. morganii]MBT0452065.1 hypothetical protein [Morganella morganii subsp. morganii]MCW9738005.1 hypothetical protein [Morganella morganii]
MSRSDMIFNITYSYYLNEMQSRFSGRIDKFISIVLFVLGGSVLASLLNVIFVGSVVSILSAIQFFYQFGKQSSVSDERAKKYLSLMHHESRLTDDELHSQLDELLKTDTPVFGFLENPAYKRASIKLDLVDETKLSWAESIFAWLAGDLPK